MIGVRADGDLRTLARTLATIDEIDYVVIASGGTAIFTGAVSASAPAAVIIKTQNSKIHFFIATAF